MARNRIGYQSTLSIDCSQIPVHTTIRIDLLIKFKAIEMNFYTIFTFFALALAVFAAQTEAGWLKKIGKKIERVGQHTRDATIQTIAVAQQAANVAATVRG